MFAPKVLYLWPLEESTLTTLFVNGIDFFERTAGSCAATMNCSFNTSCSSRQQTSFGVGGSRADQNSNNRVVVWVIHVVRNLLYDIEEPRNKFIIHACWGEVLALPGNGGDSVCRTQIIIRNLLDPGHFIQQLHQGPVQRLFMFAWMSNELDQSGKGVFSIQHVKRRLVLFGVGQQKGDGDAEHIDVVLLQQAVHQLLSDVAGVFCEQRRDIEEIRTVAQMVVGRDKLVVVGVEEG